MKHLLNPTRRFQMSLRRLIAVVAVASLLCAYGASYHRLSRRGLAEARDYGIGGFLYVPVGETAGLTDLRRHYVLAAFFEPVCWLDRRIFGTPTPWVSFCMQLSG